MNNRVPVTQVIVMAIVISVMLLFLGFGVLLLIHICIVGNTLGRGMPAEQDLNMVERGSLGSTSMSRDDIEKLPCFDFEAKAKGSSPAGDCAVCLENFRAGEKCRLLPSCNHSFHAECVDLWLLRVSVCPICRAGAECTDLGCVHGDENNRFDENGGENSVVEIGEVQQGESGNFDRGELGLNQTVEVVVSSRNSSPEREILV